MSKRWLSVYLFYTAPTDVFLAKAVKPLIDTLLKTGAIEQFFFIRYDERGPHIRLRILAEQPVIDKIILPNLTEHFNNYFKMYPSSRVEPSYHPDTPADQIWFPNNSVQIVDYEPETARYGGENGLKYSERQFYFSSKATLEALLPASRNNLPYDQILGVAIKLHLAMAYAYGMTMDKAADFFAAIFTHWIPFAVGRERMLKEQYNQLLKKMTENYQQGFLEQKSALTPYIAAVWAACKEENGFEEEFMNEWLRENKRLALELRLAYAQNTLQQRPPEYLLQIHTSTDEEDLGMWQFYADFVHLTNNRLGIGNEDESYIAYLITRGLEENLS